MPNLREKREEINARVVEAIAAARFAPRPTFAQKRRQKKPKPRRLFAYDFETTRIQPGTPRPLYLTAYGHGLSLATPIRDMTHLGDLLRAYFLIPENEGAAFVGWNANRFDAYFVAAALLTDPELHIRPYMTRSKAVRGLRIVRGDPDDKHAPSWEFLDGIAMTGLVGTTLEKFVGNFAPDFPKLSGTIDFDSEDFNPANPDHCAYALRDSEGLWHAINRAQQIMLDTFDQPLAVTMGGACIRVLQAHVPEGVSVVAPTVDLSAVLSSYVMRGGFCFCNRRYHGPVWKYDINQAYASAMREAALPAGGALHFKGMPPAACKTYAAHVTRATNPRNAIPFYYRSRDERGRLRAMFSTTEIADTWLTSIEVDQLRAEGWQIDISECWIWGQSFNLRDYVDKLERLRTTCEGGPSGPIGTMVKAVGNHSYGKTVEELEPIQYVIAAQCPPGYFEAYESEHIDAQPLQHVYYTIDDERRPKDYHQPQLGAWITAHVRMVLRRAALLAPDAWLYADTDCVVFSRDVSHLLDIDSKRYGAWKVEEAGTVYRIIAKKVYAQDGGDKPKRSAKGLNVKRLSADDFAEWYDGRPPVQEQTQINNFLSVMQGAEMYRRQTRAGTRIETMEHAA